MVPSNPITILPNNSPGLATSTRQRRQEHAQEQRRLWNGKEPRRVALTPCKKKTENSQFIRSFRKAHAMHTTVTMIISWFKHTQRSCHANDIHTEQTCRSKKTRIERCCCVGNRFGGGWAEFHVGPSMISTVKKFWTAFQCVLDRRWSPKVSSIIW
jgi:hypothetical protein